MPVSVRKAVIKLLIATLVLATLILLCFADINEGLKGVLIVFIIILAFPITLLIGIDASRTIRRDLPSHKSLRLLGRFLAFPQAIMGIVLIGFAVVYPLFGVRELADDLARGTSPVMPLARLVIAILGFCVGLHYVREGLGMRRRRPCVHSIGSNDWVGPCNNMKGTLPQLLIPIILAALILCSVRTFWRTSDDARQVRIYVVTKFWCTFVTVFGALFLPLVIPIPDDSYLFKAVYWAFFIFPVTLCMGYLCARVFFAIVDTVQKR